jgi:hypothetical protein
MGAEIGRKEAAAARFASEADAGKSINSGEPTPSAAEAIVARLQRERGTAGEGYMSGLGSDP